MNAMLAQLFQETSQKTAQLLESLSVLGKFTCSDLDHVSEKEFLETMLESLLDYQDIDGCVLYLSEHENLNLYAKVDWNGLVNYSESDLARTGIQAGVRIENSPVGRAARDETIVHESSILLSSVLDLPENSENKAQEIGLRPEKGSLLCFPLKAFGTLFGVMCVYHLGQNAFARCHEQFFSLFGFLLAQQLGYRRLFRTGEFGTNTDYASLVKELEAAEKAKAELLVLTRKDDLTGLHNRRAFMVDCQSAIARAQRYGHPFSLVLMDVANFRELLFQHGIIPCDELLNSISGLLKAFTREGDILARYAGEQFVLALPETDITGARQLAERISNSVMKKKWWVAGQSVVPVCQVGVAALAHEKQADSAKKMKELLQNACNSLKQEKKFCELSDGSNL